MNETVDTPIVEDLDIKHADAVLDDGAGRQSEHQATIPPGIKTGLLGLLFVVFVVGTVVVMVLTPSDPVEETVVFDEASLSDIASQEPLVDTPLIALDPDPGFVDKDSVEKTQSVERLDEKILALEQALHQSSSLITMQRDAVARQGNSIQEVMANLEQSRAWVTESARQIDVLKERLATLEAAVGQNSDQLRLIKTKATRQRQARPSFQLLSIDRWGGQDSVVLALQDQTTVAAIGDTRAGWSIQSIDRPNCIGVIRLSDQAKAKVCKRNS